MKHLTILDHGMYLGVTSERLSVGMKSGETTEYPLGRIRSVTIAREGVSISSNAILSCTQRGIRIFFLDWRGQPAACIYGASSHATVGVRRAQLKATESYMANDLAARILEGKIRNQRAVLLYFGKSLTDEIQAGTIVPAADRLMSYCDRIKEGCGRIPMETLLGIEGLAARDYFTALSQADLLPDSFCGRIGRGATEPANAALNYGYAILQSYVWNAVINAGLEPYAGVVHVDRPGKPSLVLDLMEEYRPWVVDRSVIKLRSALKQLDDLSPAIRRRIVVEIHETMSRKYDCHGKQLRLETILQRQVYRVAGYFMGQKIYKPYIFRW